MTAISLERPGFTIRQHLICL
ncbi:MAG: hypothetical protein QOH05_4249, partial [Acetobacteraceae bacterium]|nr:hypothetical protein [Acetobacteraceae bacterium]